MALMAAHGEITPMPKCAIFADTQDEPKEVYEWLSKLEQLVPFEVVHVTAGRLSENLVNAYGHSEIPSFVIGNGNPQGKRQCTRNFKIRPIRTEIRRRCLKSNVMLWQGISLEEVHRMKPADVQWLTHIWPLIDRRMTRWDCKRWLQSHGYDVPPKSACVYCPYRGNRQWKQSLQKSYDRTIINKVEAVLLPRGEFLHKSCVPLDQVDLSTDEDRGQQVMFGNECEGMCGV